MGSGHRVLTGQVAALGPMEHLRPSLVIKHYAVMAEDNLKLAKILLRGPN